MRLAKGLAQMPIFFRLFLIVVDEVIDACARKRRVLVVLSISRQGLGAIAIPKKEVYREIMVDKQGNQTAVLTAPFSILCHATKQSDIGPKQD